MSEKTNLIPAYRIEDFKLLNKGRSSAEVLSVLKNEWHIELTLRQLNYLKSKLGCPSGVDTKLKKGHTAWNKGNKGFCPSPETQFKKGNQAAALPLGEERFLHVYDKVPYIKTKNGWKLKHHIEWERLNNKKIPKGYDVIFLDKDTTNFSKENLCLTRKGNLMNLRRNNLDKNPEVTKLGLTILDLNAKVKEKERECKQK